MKTYPLIKKLSTALLACGLTASQAVSGNSTIIEDFEAFGLGVQSGNQAGTFDVIEGLSPGSTRALEANNSFRHIFPWNGPGQTVTTFSFDFFNPTTGNTTFSDGRVIFALNQNSANIASGANNLIRMVATAQSDESAGVFELHQTGGSEFANDSYPMNTMVTVHFVLNNTSDPATNAEGVSVAANSVQLWTEIDGDQMFAGSATITEDRFNADLAYIGIGTFGAYDRTGFVIDNIRFTDGIAVIPEPSAYAALAGLLALGLVITRRRLLRKS